MTAIQGVFLFAAALILWGAFMMVTRKNMVHAALFLIMSLFGVAILFVLLEAGFLAVIQVLVYIGAIAILMIFAVMFTRGDGPTDESPVNSSYGWAAMLAALFCFGLVVLLSLWPAISTVAAPALAEGRDTVVELGLSLVSPDAYVIPFEVASVMLLAALIGALFVARPQKKEK